MIKGALSNIPMYYTSLYKVLVKVVCAVEKYPRDFLWEGGRQRKDHLVKWETVMKPKEQRGLGVGKIKERNVALMGKWL